MEDITPEEALQSQSTHHLSLEEQVEILTKKLEKCEEELERMRNFIEQQFPHYPNPAPATTLSGKHGITKKNVSKGSPSSPRETKKKSKGLSLVDEETPKKGPKSKPTKTPTPKKTSHSNEDKSSEDSPKRSQKKDKKKQPQPHEYNTTTDEEDNEPSEDLTQSETESEEKPKKSTTKKRTKTPKDPNAPKRPPSPYLLFLSESLLEKGNNSQATFGEISRSQAKLWKEMTEQQKEPFVEKAKEAKKKYKIQLADYNKSKDK